MSKKYNHDQRMDIKFDHHEMIELNPNQGTTISKGVMHRPRAPHKTVMLMVETDTIDPVGQEKE